MNVYDFDKTVRRGDSTVHFTLWCLRHHPRTALSLLGTLPKALGWKLGLCSLTAFKRRLFRYLRYVPDMDAELAAFWQAEEKLLRPWYLAQKRPDDVIISASPEFLLRPMCEKLGVMLLASPVDARTGEFSGANCQGAEKVRRFYAAFPRGHAEAFYSDSLSDTPMAQEADRAFLVRGDRLSPWPQKKTQ